MKLEKLFDKNFDEYTITFIRPNKNIDTKIIKKEDVLFYIDNVNNFTSINNIPLSAIKSISVKNKKYYNVPNFENNYDIKSIVYDYTKVPNYINGTSKNEDIKFDKEIKNEILNNFNDDKKIMKGFFNYLDAKTATVSSLEIYYIRLDDSLKSDPEFIASILNKDYKIKKVLVDDLSDGFFKNKKCIDFLFNNLDKFNPAAAVAYMHYIDKSLLTKEVLIRFLKINDLSINFFIKSFNEDIINDDDVINELIKRHQKQYCEKDIKFYIKFINSKENLIKIFPEKEIASFLGYLHKDIISDKKFIEYILTNYNCNIFGDNKIINYYKNNMYMINLLSKHCNDIQCGNFLTEAEINKERAEGNEKLQELVATNIYFINWMSKTDIEIYFASEVESIDNIYITHCEASFKTEKSVFDIVNFDTDFGMFMVDNYGNIKYKNKDGNNICQIERLDTDIRKIIIDGLKGFIVPDLEIHDIKRLGIMLYDKRMDIINKGEER